MRPLRWVFGLVFQNFAWKLLALAIAVMIWALVASEPELSTVVTARVLHRNLADDLVVAHESTSTVELELRGSSAALRGLGEMGIARPSVELDLTGVRAGEHAYRITANDVRLPHGVWLRHAEPSQIVLTIKAPSQKKK